MPNSIALADYHAAADRTDIIQSMVMGLLVRTGGLESPDDRAAMERAAPRLTSTLSAAELRRAARVVSDLSRPLSSVLGEVVETVRLMREMSLIVSHSILPPVAGPSTTQEGEV